MLLSLSTRAEAGSTATELVGSILTKLVGFMYTRLN